MKISADILYNYISDILPLDWVRTQNDSYYDKENINNFIYETPNSVGLSLGVKRDVFKNAIKELKKQFADDGIEYTSFEMFSGEVQFGKR